MKYLVRLAAAAGFVAAATAANAVTVVNGSFELGTDPGGSFTTLLSGSTAITGWTVGGDSVDYIGPYWQASDGVRSVDLSGNAAGSVSQLLTGLVTGFTYTVHFDLAGNPDAGPTLKAAISTGGAASAVFFFDTAAAGSTLADMKWTGESFSFVATAPTTNLTFSSATFTAYGPALDNVSISAGVPEPATWAMMLLGFAGLALATGRRRRTVVAAA